MISNQKGNITVLAAASTLVLFGLAILAMETTMAAMTKMVMKNISETAALTALKAYGQYREMGVSAEVAVGNARKLGMEILEISKTKMPGTTTLQLTGRTSDQIIKFGFSCGKTSGPNSVGDFCEYGPRNYEGPEYARRINVVKVELRSYYDRRINWPFLQFLKLNTDNYYMSTSSFAAFQPVHVAFVVDSTSSMDDRTYEPPDKCFDPSIPNRTFVSAARRTPSPPVWQSGYHAPSNLKSCIHHDSQSITFENPQLNSSVMLNLTGAVMPQPITDIMLTAAYDFMSNPMFYTPHYLTFVTFDQEPYEPDYYSGYFGFKEAPNSKGMSVFLQFMSKMAVRPGSLWSRHASWFEYAYYNRGAPYPYEWYYNTYGPNFMFPGGRQGYAGLSSPGNITYAINFTVDKLKAVRNANGQDDFIFLITDGPPNAGTQMAAELASDKNIRIYPVYFANDRSRPCASYPNDFLRAKNEIAVPAKGHAFCVDEAACDPTQRHCLRMLYREFFPHRSVQIVSSPPPQDFGPQYPSWEPDITR